MHGRRSGLINKPLGRQDDERKEQEGNEYTTRTRVCILKNYV